MATDELKPITDVPTLHSVVTVGDETVIQSRRIGQQLEHEMDENLGAALSQEIIQSMAAQASDHSVHSIQAETPIQNDDWYSAQTNVEPDPTPVASSPITMDDTLELLIDDIVDRHIIALRQDIRLLLENALSDS